MQSTHQQNVLHYCSVVEQPLLMRGAAILLPFPSGHTKLLLRNDVHMATKRPFRLSVPNIFLYY